MSLRILLITIAWLLILLCCACQPDAPASTPYPAEEPAPATPTELRPSPTVRPGVPVPHGGEPVIDGVMSPGEWDGAWVGAFDDGSELLLMHAESTLYLGIRSVTAEMIVGNIFLERGDEVAILHVSAALGTAVYRRGRDSWGQTQAFDWRCRRTDKGEAAQAERAAFLEQERWVSVNSRMGTPNELEYRIEMVGDSLRLAANLLRSSDPDSKVPWPAGLDDDCVLPTPGGLPAELHFSPDKWMTIWLSPD